MSDSHLQQLWHKLVLMASHFIYVLVDILFLGLWVLAQEAVAWLTAWGEAHLSSVNRSAWAILELVFAVSTIVPLLMYILQDLIALWHRIRLELDDPENKG